MSVRRICPRGRKKQLMLHLGGLNSKAPGCRAPPASVPGRRNIPVDMVLQPLESYNGKIPPPASYDFRPEQRERVYHYIEKPDHQRGKGKHKGRGKGKPGTPPKGKAAGDWECPNCHDIAFAWRTACRLCHAPKPPPAPEANTAVSLDRAADAPVASDPEIPEPSTARPSTAEQTAERRIIFHAQRDFSWDIKRKAEEQQVQLQWKRRRAAEAEEQQLLPERVAPPDDPGDAAEAEEYEEKCMRLLSSVEDLAPKDLQNFRPGLDICARLRLGQAPILKQPKVPELLTHDEAWKLFKETGYLDDFNKRESGHKDAETWYTIDFSKDNMKVAAIRAMSDTDLERVKAVHQKNDKPEDILRKLEEVRGQSLTECFTGPIEGWEVIFPVRGPPNYQDGHPLVDDEVLFKHTTREGLLNSVQMYGVAPSIPSHESEGLWMFGLPSYAWGNSRCERTGGIILTMAVPRRLGENLLHNTSIRGGGSFGHLRFVNKGINGKPWTCRCRVVTASFKLLDRDYMEESLRLRRALGACVPWLFQSPWTISLDKETEKMFKDHEYSEESDLRDAAKKSEAILLKVSRCGPRPPLPKYCERPRIYPDSGCRRTCLARTLDATHKIRARQMANFLQASCDGKTSWSHLLQPPAREQLEVIRNLDDSIYEAYFSAIPPLVDSAADKKNLPKKWAQFKSALMRMVERRVIYACAVSLEFAFSEELHLDRERRGILSGTTDYTFGMAALSGVLAKIVYALQLLEANSIARGLAILRTIPMGRVPLPMLQFLVSTFPRTHWENIFLVKEGLPNCTRSQHWLNLERSDPEQRQIFKRRGDMTPPEDPAPSASTAPAPHQGARTTRERPIFAIGDRVRAPWPGCDPSVKYPGICVRNTWPGMHLQVDFDNGQKHYHANPDLAELVEAVSESSDEEPPGTPPYNPSLSQATPCAHREEVVRAEAPSASSGDSVLVTEPRPRGSILRDMVPSTLDPGRSPTDQGHRDTVVAPNPDLPALAPLLKICHYEESFASNGKHDVPEFRIKMKNKVAKKTRSDGGDPRTRDVCAYCLQWLQDSPAGFTILSGD